MIVQIGGNRVSLQVQSSGVARASQIIRDGLVDVGALESTATAAAAASQASRLAADADAVATTADRVQTGLDRVATGADSVATAADRVQTGLDRVQTAADRVQTGLDRVATAADVIAVEDQGVTSIAAVAAQGVTSVAAVASQQGTSIAAVASQQTTSVAAVVAQETTSIAAVAAQGVTSTAAVTAEGESQIVDIANAVAAIDYPTSANALSSGVASVAITAGGTGGTTGTYTWTTTGGAGTNASGYLTVAGGAITSVVVQQRGYSYTSAPTIVIAGTHNVTGHTLTPSIAINRPIGSFWRIKVTDGWQVFENVASVATSRGIYADRAIFQTLDDALLAIHQRINREDEGNLPEAAVVILLGQSNNGAYGTAINTKVNENAYMPVAANNIGSFPFYAANQGFTAHHNDFASFPVHTEGTDESPLSGLLRTFMGGRFRRAYCVSAAMGGHTIEQLFGGGPSCNLQATIKRLCEKARLDGYRPVVMFSFHHGEANMTAGDSEATYTANMLAYCRYAQLLAAIYSRQPNHIAPIVFHLPIMNGSGTDGANSRTILNALRRAVPQLAGGIGPFSSYQFNSKSDRIHQEPSGYEGRGEDVGYWLKRYWEHGEVNRGLYPAQVLWDGVTTVWVDWNHPEVEDANPTDTMGAGYFDFGLNLNAAQWKKGFRWVDNGSVVLISAVTHYGLRTRLTLATTPVGTAAQQSLQLASQTTTSSLTSGSSNRSGSAWRAKMDGRPTKAGIPLDARYLNQYIWAGPGSYAVIQGLS